MSNKFDITQIKFHVRRLTAPDEWIEFTEATVRGKKLGKNTTWIRMLAAEHSPIRCQMYRIYMVDIPTFVSTHFVRHSIGIVHGVESNRDDRGAIEIANRLTPVRHLMDINAQAFMNMSHARLCAKSHIETRKVMKHMVDAMELVDPDLSAMCMPKCEYRGGRCFELQYCGKPGIAHVNTKDFDRYSLSDKPCTRGACSI